MKLIRNNWDNPMAKERLELVFENRNHDYGAYPIRRDYSRTVLIAFLSTFALAFILAGAPYIWNLLHPEQQVRLVSPGETIIKFIEVTLPEKETIKLPEEQKNEKLQPSKPAGSEQFTNLKVKDQDSSNVNTQDQLLTMNTGTKTIKSDSVKVVDPFPVDPKPAGNGSGSVFKWAEKMPSFPGGEAEMLKYLQKNIRYPAEAREIGLDGTVYLSFVVTTSGDIAQVNVLRGIGGGCEEEAIRVIKKMPAWNVGLQNGNPVNVQFTLPVTFKLK